MATAVGRSTTLEETTRPERLRRWVVVLGVSAIVANLGTGA
jgi:hypothetical protein